MNREYDLNRLQKEKLTNQFRKAYIDVKGYCLPDRYIDVSQLIENLEVRDEDIWVCSFPKSGSSWAQEMIWCLCNDLDFEGAKKLLSLRFPYLEATAMCYRFSTTDDKPGGSMKNFRAELIDSVRFVDGLPTPRYIKTHLPFTLLPEEIRSGQRKPKLIYVTRNPKDTCMSYFLHCRRTLFDKITFEEFYALYLGGKVSYGPYWDHVLSYRNEVDKRKNIFTIEFEEMKADLPSVIEKTANFLNKSISEDEIKDLATHLSFERMRDNPAVNHKEIIEPFTKYSAEKIKPELMRCGQVDQWQGFMTNEMAEEIDNLTEQKFKGFKSQTSSNPS